jgi:uncharacterized membrane protein
MEFLFIIIVAVYTVSLGHRLTKVENELRAGRPDVSLSKEGREYLSALGVTPPQGSENAPSEVPYSQAPSPASFSPISAPAFTPISTEPQENSFVTWLKQDFLVKLGGLLILIAFGWIVSYAFANNYIGEMGRIMLGLIVGVFFMGAGVYRSLKSVSQGSIFVIIGSALVILTVTAARELYEFFTPSTALLIMFVAIVFVAFMSVQLNRQSLALAGLLMGACAPFLVGGTDPSVVMLSLYLLVLIAGTLWVVWRTGSPYLTPAALGVVSMYNLLYVEFSFEEQLKGLFFAFLFTFIFFLTNIVSVHYRPQQQCTTGQLLTALGTAIYLVVWIAAAAPATWQTVLYICWMLVFSMGAYAVYRMSNHRNVFYVYSAVALGCLGAATVNEFSGPVLSIVLTIEIAGIILMASQYVQAPVAARQLSFLLTIPALLSLEHIGSPQWNSGIIHGDFIALLVIANAFLIVASQLPSSPADENEITGQRILYIMSGVYGLILVWLISHALFAADVATTISLIVYTIIGLAMYVRGKRHSYRALEVSGGLLLALVVGRLLFVEVWDMALTTRIITFVVIGVLLLSTAFIKKERTLE